MSGVIRRHADGGCDVSTTSQVCEVWLGLDRADGFQQIIETCVQFY